MVCGGGREGEEEKDDDDDYHTFFRRLGGMGIGIAIRVFSLWGSTKSGGFWV